MAYSQGLLQRWTGLTVDYLEPFELCPPRNPPAEMVPVQTTLEVEWRRPRRWRLGERWRLSSVRFFQAGRFNPSVWGSVSGFLRSRLQAEASGQVGFRGRNRPFGNVALVPGGPVPAEHVLLPGTTHRNIESQRSVFGVRYQVGVGCGTGELLRAHILLQAHWR